MQVEVTVRDDNQKTGMVKTVTFPSYQNIPEGVVRDTIDSVKEAVVSNLAAEGEIEPEDENTAFLQEVPPLGEG
jgi:hypothetical protein